jgi:predicted nucleic acid-binding Zn ribbon protein
MAIIIRGKTKCFICGAVIEDEQPVRSFPHFIQNELDPLAVFNDGAFHLECFRNQPLAQKAEELYDEMLRHLTPTHRVCVVCNKPLSDPDDYFTVGYLTEDETAPAHVYNYTQAHRSCLPTWRQLRNAYELIKHLRFSPSWRGQTLDRVLLQLEKAIQQSEQLEKS